MVGGNGGSAAGCSEVGRSDPCCAETEEVEAGLLCSTIGCLWKIMESVTTARFTRTSLSEE
jgi:hypothetical protein